MADRVHPHDSFPPNPEAPKDAVSIPIPDPDPLEKPLIPEEKSGKPLQKPGTYVTVQLPKDVILRVPPEENAKRYQQLSKRKNRRSSCCGCCRCLLISLLLLLLALGITAAVLYLVFRPESPNYTVENVAIKGFNLTSPSPISPEFDVAVRADNPNKKIGIYYEKGSSVEILYGGAALCTGSLPVFFQPANNVTVFTTAAKANGVNLTSSILKGLADAEKNGAVPLTLKLIAPVKLKLGAVKTWKFAVKVTCDITVDKLTAASKIVSKKCNYGVNWKESFPWS